MQKRSHKLLASTLLEQHQGFRARRFELAFLFGSFEPDCNPLSYLKGSIHNRFLMGHNYENSQRYIRNHIQKLQCRDRWNIWQYYTLGKLTHYIADAFTYPHNNDFPGSMKNHHCYESNLREQLIVYLAECKELLADTLGDDLISELEELHQQYLVSEAHCQRDINYILRANSLLMRGCLPQQA